MKRTFAYLLFSLPFLIMLGGCLKNNQEPTPLPQITGNFAGQFVRLRLNKTTNKYDTLRANVNLNINLTTGFTISGGAHAPGNGDFSYDAYYFRFDDKTFPTTGFPAEPHLHGLYEYNYASDQLVLRQIFPLDTLAHLYNLKKVN